MKVRQGFVSNSSTTSFCVYGWYYSPEDLEKLKNEMGKLVFLSKVIDLKDEDREKLENNPDEIDDWISDCYNSGVLTEGQEGYSYYLGVNVREDIDPDTLKKKAEQIRKDFGIPEGCNPSWHQEAWRDG